jgi:hypothetical protein
VKDGYAMLSILEPGSDDLFLALPRDRAITFSGGTRGSVDVSSIPAADMDVGFVGDALDGSPLDFLFSGTMGEALPIVVDAPELGLNMATISLLGGHLLAIGLRKFTDDSSRGGGRCQGVAPGPNQLGCFAVRADRPMSASWTFSGRYKLGEVSGIVGALSGVLMGMGPPDLASLAPHVAPIARLSHSGVRLAITTPPFPNIDVSGQTGDCSDPNLADYASVCRGDASHYVSIPIAADHPQSLNTSLAVPQLPATATGAFTPTMVVLGGAEVPALGFVPIGSGSALDATGPAGGPDGVVDGIEMPFGPASQSLAAGHVAFSGAPRHGGLEDASSVLIAIAIAAASEPSLRRSMLIQPVDRIAATATIAGPFLDFPSASVDLRAGTVSQAAAPARANVLRLRLATPDGSSWLVYAPGSALQFRLPDVAAPRALLSASLNVDVALALAGNYGALWHSGLAHHLDRPLTQFQAAAHADCRAAAMTGCALR